MRSRTRIRKRTHKDRDRDDRDRDDDLYLIKEDFFTVDVEEWTYNFGPSRFIRTLIFRNDRLVLITDGGYGYDEPDRDRVLNHGDSKALVFMKYGKPEEEKTSVTYQSRINREDQGDRLIVEEVSFPVRKDVWVYDRGHEKFLLQVVFKNNQLVDDRTLKSRGKKSPKK